MNVLAAMEDTMALARRYQELADAYISEQKKQWPVRGTRDYWHTHAFMQDKGAHA